MPCHGNGQTSADSCAGAIRALALARFPRRRHGAVIRVQTENRVADCCTQMLDWFGGLKHITDMDVTGTF